MKIGIIGSTCNPPHNQHIAIGEAARRELGLDRLVLLPVKNPPHKKEIAVPMDARIFMARLAVVGKSGWEVSDVDRLRKGKSYTKNLISELKKKHPKDELFWIIGSDALLSMPWNPGGYELFDLCRFVVAPRNEFPVNRADKRILKKVIILKNKGRKVSSTKIRREIFVSDGVKKYVSPHVFKFIKGNNLYAPKQAVLL